jgi:hypothetical protein
MKPDLIEAQLSYVKMKLDLTDVQIRYVMMKLDLTEVQICEDKTSKYKLYYDKTRSYRRTVC